MKKKLLVILCVVAMLAACLLVSVFAADTTRTAYCEHCKQEVTWEKIVFGAKELPEGETSVHKHYYLDKSYVSKTVNDQISTRSGVTVCLDLNGHSWQSYGRAFNVSVTSGSTEGSTLNLMDTVGGGEVVGLSSTDVKGDGSGSKTNNIGGGTIWVEANCKLNVYSGTYKLNVTTPDNLRTNNGGIVALNGASEMNLYGGTIEGALVGQKGGAIHLYGAGQLNLYGGRVTRGTSVLGTGNCISTGANGMIRLSGAAEIDEIWSTDNYQKLAVDSAFTGWANLAYQSGKVTAAEGLQIGTGIAGSLENGWLMCDLDDGYRVINDGTKLVLAAIPDGVLYRTCPVCGDVKFAWQPFAPKTGSTLPTGTHHCYLDRTMTEAETEQFSPKNLQICLDLYGNGFERKGRAISAGVNSVVNILDTKTGGYIQGSTNNGNPSGGTAYVGSTTGSATLNLYGGTLKYKPVTDAGYYGTGKGGVVAIYKGAFNMYGGIVEGSNMATSTYWDATAADNGSGGAIYMYGSTNLNVYGGHIKTGTAAEGKPGPCVYVHQVSCSVNLSGDGIVDNIYFRYNPQEKFAVTGTYTGSASVTFPDTLTISENMVIGTAAEADMSRGSITCTNGKGYYVPVQDGKLIISSYPNGTVAANGETIYPSVQAAVDSYTDGVIVLCKTVAEDITVKNDAVLQLAGYSITGKITVEEGATLYCLDTGTDDFDVTDGEYGKLIDVTGKVAGVPADKGLSEDSYLAVNEDGVWSFHRVKLEIYAMTLSVNGTDDKQEPGLYYKSHFLADKMAAEKIASYGVALSVIANPTERNLETKCRYSTHTGFESGPYGNLGNNSSTLLTGILKNANDEKTNRRNLNMDVYGRAYAKTEDGQILFGIGVCRSLAQQLQGIDGMVASLSENQVDAVVKLYNKFKGILADYELSGIAAAVETAEEGTLKVLVLGNSHGLDATNLLYEVFHAENEAGNIDQKVVIGALYYSGCMINQHQDFLYGNQPVYSYHKNDGSNLDRAWTVKYDATCLDALRDEQWDIILMQQMNHRAGMDKHYVAEEWKAVADYLLNNQDIRPKLGFHMTWTNPDDYELYLNDDAPYAISSAKSWRETHEQYFGGADGKYDQSVLYGEITRCVQQYLLDSTEFLGENYFDGPFIPSLTATQYAQDVLGRSQPEIYRDYTHMNDYGRLICAYLWYAEIMELEEITEVNIDAIPEVLHHKKSLFPASEDNYAVTEDMKEDLIESVNWALKNPFSLPE